MGFRNAKENGMDERKERMNKKDNLGHETQAIKLKKERKRKRNERDRNREERDGGSEGL
jgi:hypothetical protein